MSNVIDFREKAKKRGYVMTVTFGDIQNLDNCTFQGNQFNESESFFLPETTIFYEGKLIIKGDEEETK